MHNNQTVKTTIRSFLSTCLFFYLVVFTIILTSFSILLINNVKAATFSISSAPVGTVITMGNQKFVKINVNGMFVALQQFRPPGSATGMTMQNFTTADCQAFHKPTGAKYTLVGNLVDSRDNKQYEVRKFSDGKCWMVDNLRYGGGTNGSGDYCAGKMTLRNATSQANSSATTTNGLNPPSGPATLVGGCRDAAAGATTPPCQGTTRCGYYYNWPGAMQDQNAWNNNPSYTQPTQPRTGICPQGWHLPMGGATAQTSEYVALDVSVGGTGANNQTSGPAFTFWRPGGNFKSLHAGTAGATGNLNLQGSNGTIWSSTQSSAGDAFSLAFYIPNISPQISLAKNYGHSVRCVKN